MMRAHNGQAEKFKYGLHLRSCLEGKERGERGAKG